MQTVAAITDQQPFFFAEQLLRNGCSIVAYFTVVA
jgi:hypothetical protein